MADYISAYVSDGTIQNTSASQQSLSTSKSSSSSSLDKDAFLQLLVAQMKYQDPLEPTENTEYISQLANFSELEEMQNMTSSMSLQRASGLVGQEVVLKVTNSVTGNTETVSGYVDYVVYENNKAFISVNDNLYSVDDVYEVVDHDYSAASELGKQFNEALSKLPSVSELTLSYEQTITNLRNAYESLSDYQKSFISQDSLDTLKKYEDKIQQLKLAQDSTTES